MNRAYKIEREKINRKTSVKLPTGQTGRRIDEKVLEILRSLIEYNTLKLIDKCIWYIEGTDMDIKETERSSYWIPSWFRGHQICKPIVRCGQDARQSNVKKWRLREYWDVATVIQLHNSHQYASRVLKLVTKKHGIFHQWNMCSIEHRIKGLWTNRVDYELLK